MIIYCSGAVVFLYRVFPLAKINRGIESLLRKQYVVTLFQVWKFGLQSFSLLVYSYRNVRTKYIGTHFFNANHKIGPISVISYCVFIN